MQTSKDKYIAQVLKGFQNNKGKSSVYCYITDVIPELVYNIVYNFNNKHPKEFILIVVDDYNTRCKIINCLNQHNIYNPEVSVIKVLTKTYINLKYSYTYKLCITVGINDDINIIKHLNTNAGFMISILTENIMNNDFITTLRSFLPSINIDNVDASIRADQIYSPVEEHRYGVELSNDDKALYNKYTDYINTSVSIFGTLDNIEKCKKGDVTLGISGAEFRNTIARENGWSEDLDTNIEFMKQIDDIYNPNSLFERACTFYTITKQRRDLVCDNIAKLEVIKNICCDNKDKKILIISKRSEFASKVTRYINEHSDVKCGDYHDCIKDDIAYDSNGIPIIVKSGINKGKPRVLGAQAQSSLNERLYNEGCINILSIKSASNPKLKIACDIVIFTSSLCDNITDVRTRFINVSYNNIPTITYRLYCNNTIEFDKMNKEKEQPTIKVVNDTEIFIGYDENSGDIIL